MTEVQKKSFELLEIFVSICDKWDIPYFLVCGSALGAVKYGGYIPWDDDTDVGLLRKDYQRFLEVAPKELPEWCFLQNYKTEKYYTLAFSKIRNNNTTFLEKNYQNFDMNHGIYIDVFPIDGYPDNSIASRMFEMKQKINAWIRNSIYESHTIPKIARRNKVLRFFGVHKLTYQAHEYLERLYSKYPPEKSKLWCNYGNWQGKRELAPQWHYGNGTWATFEGLKVRIPENYDAYLTQKYGDWRKDPPLEKQQTHHITTIIDTEKSYKYYLHNSK